MGSDFISLKDVVETCSFPVTISVKSDENRRLLDGRSNVFTLFHRQTYLSVKCLNGNHKEVSISADSTNSVRFLSIDNTSTFKTLAELRLHKKKHVISWFVATRDFRVDGVVYRKGQIFTFASVSLIKSFKRERQRGITVQLFPSMRRCFLPLSVEGYFRKCDPPSVTQKCQLNELAKSENLPFYFCLDSTTDQLNESSTTTEFCYAYEKCTENVVFASQKDNGALKMHVLSSNFPLTVKILSEGLRGAVDVPDAREIVTALSKVTLPVASEILDNFYKVFTYAELGITRLLEEIFVELNEKIAMIGNGQNTVIGKFFVPSKMNSSKPRVRGGNGNRQSHIYINETQNTSETRQREIVVEFDDGGYVIIPFLGKTPKIILDKEELAYISSINYGYNYASTKSLEEPIYTYIAADELDINPNNCGPKQEYLELEYTGDNIRYSLSYDYPHINHFRMPRAVGKQSLSGLSASEVADVLKINLLKRYIEIFREKNINGVGLTKLTETDMLSMNFTRFEARKLKCFIDGWRPLKETESEELWLAKMSSDWTVTDLSRYLLHINMRSFERFSSRHNIDGFLLKQILKDDIIDSIKTEHSIIFGDKELERLRKYVTEDHQPKFKYIK